MPIPIRPGFLTLCLRVSTPFPLFFQVYFPLSLQFLQSARPAHNPANARCSPVLSSPAFLSLSVYQTFASPASAKFMKLTRCPHPWVVSDDMNPSSTFCMLYLKSNSVKKNHTEGIISLEHQREIPIQGDFCIFSALEMKKSHLSITNSFQVSQLKKNRPAPFLPCRHCVFTNCLNGMLWGEGLCPQSPLPSPFATDENESPKT